MSKPLITLSPNSTIKDALQTMQQKNIRRISIVDGATMKGIIIDKDVFRAILNNKISLDTPVGASAIAEAHRRFLIGIENNLRIFCKKGNNNNS